MIHTLLQFQTEKILFITKRLTDRQADRHTAASATSRLLLDCLPSQMRKKTTTGSEGDAARHLLQRLTFSCSRSLFVQAAVCLFFFVFSITRSRDFSFLPAGRNPPVAMTHNALYLCITSSVPRAQKQLHLSDIYRRYSPPCAAFICQCSSLSLSRFLLLLLSLGLPRLGWIGGLHWALATVVYLLPRTFPILCPPSAFVHFQWKTACRLHLRN